MKKFIPHVIALSIFLIICATYFSSVFEEETILYMPDIEKFKGMSKEVVDFRDQYNKEALWNGTTFSGMPSYQSGLKSDGNLIQYVDKVLQLGLPRPLNMLFLYLIGFYILLLTLKIDYKLAIVGSIGFAFSSYFFIILQAGHMTKAHAIAYLPLIIASVLYTFREKRWLLGVAFSSLFIALQLYANHYQITYYTLIILLFIGLVQFVKELQAKTLVSFAKKTGMLIVAGLLSLATNYTKLSMTMEYSPVTQRGKSELLNKKLVQKEKGWGFDYITEYSYGKAETMTFLIPDFKGGSYGPRVFEDKDSETAAYLLSTKLNKDQRATIENFSTKYWGEWDYEPPRHFGPGSPTYVGAIIVFLFILGLVYLKSSFRIWIMITVMLSIMLGWGHNLPDLSQFFLDYFPAYDKFRAITMIMIIAEFGIALLAILALNKFLNQDNIKEKTKKFKLAFYITAGITLLFAIMPSLFGLTFLSPTDIKTGSSISDILSSLGMKKESIDAFKVALINDRESILQSDAWRSLIFIVLSASVLWMFIKGMIQKQIVVIIIGALILYDMWDVNKRYLNESHFLTKTQLEQTRGLSLNEQGDLILLQTQADQSILKLNNNKNYRVFNETRAGAAFAESRTSYFHRSIGGYSSAKMKRYQQVYDIYINPMDTFRINNKGDTIEYQVRNPNQSRMLSMLNCGWIIKSYNADALSAYKYKKKPIEVNQRWIEKGYLPPMQDAWFVSKVQGAENADKEFRYLGDVNINLQDIAIIDKRFYNLLNRKENFDNTASIKLDHKTYEPNYLKYIVSKAKSDHLAVFSEIYYEKGWDAYIDGQKVPHFRVNYILRGMIVPANSKIIEFKFEPPSYYVGERVAYASSIILLLALGFISYKEMKKS